MVDLKQTLVWLFEDAAKAWRLGKWPKRLNSFELDSLEDAGRSQNCHC